MNIIECNQSWFLDTVKYYINSTNQEIFCNHIHKLKIAFGSSFYPDSNYRGSTDYSLSLYSNGCYTYHEMDSHTQTDILRILVMLVNMQSMMNIMQIIVVYGIRNIIRLIMKQRTIQWISGWWDTLTWEILMNLMRVIGVLVNNLDC